MQKKTDKPGEVPPAAHTFLVLSRATQAMVNLIEAQLKEFDLSDTDFRILEVLMTKGPLPVNVIGPKVSLTSGSVSTAIDRLLVRDLVRREESARDRRVRNVSLTSAGKQVIGEACKRNYTLLESVMSQLTRLERNQLEEIMKSLGHRAKEMSPSDV